MEMPEIDRMFGIFPPRYGCLLISIFGLACGAIGLAGVVLYGLVEEYILKHFMKNPFDPNMKKIVLISLGLSSLLLIVANAILFLGVAFSFQGCVRAAKWIIFVLCMLIIGGAIGIPTSCFFLEDTCIIKRMSAPVTAIGYIAVAIYLKLWLYFMVVVYNLENQM